MASKYTPIDNIDWDQVIDYESDKDSATLIFNGGERIEVNIPCFTAIDLAYHKEVHKRKSDVRKEKYIGHISVK